jgi:hypothetical protein
MSGVRPPNERMRLEAFYAEKNDEELLSLLVDYQTLTEVAQGALHDELNKRRLWSDRPNQEPETSTKPLKDRENFSGVLRKGAFLLLNLITAVFGTAIVESPFDHLYHPRTIGAVLFKADLLSGIFAFALGFIVFRRWKPVAAKWVGFWGACWFALGACLDITQGSVWSRMSGTACSEGLHAAHCMKWFIFSLPAIRASFYSAGAWVCWRLGCYGTSSMENALLGRFPFPSSIKRS